MTKIKFSLHTPDKLTSYMKKFSSIEKSLLFEIAGDKIIAKTHTPDKSVVKIGSVLVTDIMDAASSNTINDIKIGMYAIDNFIATFKHFGDSAVTLEVDSSTVGAEEIATEVKAVSKSLKISFPCASSSLFRYIDQALATKLIDTKDALFSFRIDKDTLSKVSALSGLDNDSEKISIVSKNEQAFFEGKSFELNMPGVSTDEDGDISIYKSHFSFIDREDSEIFVLESKVIIKSLESDTSIIIGKVE
jgi:hypothetical protein